MFLRIFRYRVKPQMRDRHLALQARAAQFYSKYVSRSPTYFRRSGDANSWVELHWYADKAECQRVAQSVAEDIELARLWREFQETLDQDHPPTLEEFNEYELPRPVNASPISQPPLDEQTPDPARPAVIKPIVAAITEEPHAKPAMLPPADPGHIIKPTSDNGHGRNHASDKEPGATTKPEAEVTDETPPARPHWPNPPLPTDAKIVEAETDVAAATDTQSDDTQSDDTQSDDAQTDDLIIEDEPPHHQPPQPPSTTLTYNDGVWIVEPPRRDNS